MSEMRQNGKAWYDDPEFLAERDYWYGVLKDEGFQDIEILDEITRHPGHMLRGVSAGDLRRSPERIRYVHESEEYYSAARAHYWRIKDDARRHVWGLHSEGQSARQIHEFVGPRYGIPYGTVMRIIREERQAMLESQQYE